MLQQYGVLAALSTRPSTNKRFSRFVKLTIFHVYRTVLISLVLLTIQLIGLLGTVYELVTIRNWTALVFAVLFFGFVLYFVIVGMRGLLKQLQFLQTNNQSLFESLELKNRHAIFLCKDPFHCSRCGGWMLGFSIMIAGLVGAIFTGNYSAILNIATKIGVFLAFALGIIFIMLTPIHGTIERLKDWSDTHPLSHWLVKAILGFVFAMGIILVTGGIILLGHQL